MTVTGADHFAGCHPEDDEDPRPKETPREQIAEVESCWHCGTPTEHGCWCHSCRDTADVVPCEAVYHCKTCGRWWAYMTGINVTKLTFGGDDD